MARMLIDAILNGDVSLAHQLIQTGTYGCVDSQTAMRDGTALFFCCSRGYLPLAEVLIQRGANVNSKNKSLATPLHAAADWGHAHVVRLLLLKNGDVNARNHRGDTPLHVAAYRGNTEVTRCLVEGGADLRIVNSHDVTAEIEALGQGHHDLAVYLQDCEKTQYNEAGPADLSRQHTIVLDPPNGLPGEPRCASSQTQVATSCPPAPATLHQHPQQQQQQLQQPQLHHYQRQYLPQQRRRHSHCGDACHQPAVTSLSTMPKCFQSDNTSFIPVDQTSTRLLQPPRTDAKSGTQQATWARTPSSPLLGGHRRPSTCSVGSCMSEFSRSESLSSDVSSCISESRREDAELMDQPSSLSPHPSSVHYQSQALSPTPKFSQMDPPSLFQPSNPCSASHSGHHSESPHPSNNRRAHPPQTQPLRGSNAGPLKSVCSIQAPASVQSEFNSIFNSSSFSYNSLPSDSSSPQRSMSIGYSSGFSSNDLDPGLLSSSGFSSTSSDDVKTSSQNIGYSSSSYNAAPGKGTQVAPRLVMESYSPRQSHSNNSGDMAVSSSTSQISVEYGDTTSPKVRELNDLDGVCFPPSLPSAYRSRLASPAVSPTSPYFGPPSFPSKCNMGGFRTTTQSSYGSAGALMTPPNVCHPDDKNDLSSMTSPHSYLSSSSSGLPVNIPPMT